MPRNHFILFVRDQNRSRDFYASLLDLTPGLDVPGMTEFVLPGGGVLGLMPSHGISKLLGSVLPEPVSGEGVPRAELYLVRNDAKALFERALEAGATLLSPFEDRDWGHNAAYCMDPDGHVVALAKEIDHRSQTVKDRVIMTTRLRLRPFRMSDGPDIQRLAGAKAIAEMTATIPHPYEDGMAEEWIAGHEEASRCGSAYHWALTVKENDVLLGGISLMDIDIEKAEMGYWIGVEFWGRGYCTEAARAVVAWAYDSLGLNRVHAHHFSRNPASGAVLKKIGMRHEGSRRQHFSRWGRREDIELYGVLASDLRG